MNELSTHTEPSPPCLCAACSRAARMQAIKKFAEDTAVAGITVIATAATVYLIMRRDVDHELGASLEAAKRDSPRSQLGGAGRATKAVQNRMTQPATSPPPQPPRTRYVPVSGWQAPSPSAQIARAGINQIREITTPGLGRTQLYR
jgi:hypothetical protein